MLNNLILSTDSYKVSHWSQFPQGLQYSQYYVESRGGEFDKIMVDGIAYLCDILQKGVDANDVEEANKLYKEHFGSEVFNKEGWDIIANELQGKLPIRVRAIPQGLVVPTKTPILVIENTDPRFGWLPGYLETFVLRAVWYPSTVATISFGVKKIIREFMKKTADDSQLASEAFKLHDFGSRGVSSGESSAIGGLSHLINFKGTDNVEALVLAKKLYGNSCAGYSIPASEHSIQCSYGELRQDDYFNKMIDFLEN